MITPLAPALAVQYTLALFVAVAPLTVYARLIHTSPSPPALAVGAAYISSNISSAKGAQFELPFKVIVKVTVVPSSPAAGVYVGVNVVPFVITPLAPALAVHNIVL